MGRQTQNSKAQRKLKRMPLETQQNHKLSKQFQTCPKPDIYMIYRKYIDIDILI